MPEAQAYAARRKRAQENLLRSREENKDLRKLQLENEIKIANNELAIHELRQSTTSRTRSDETKARIYELRNEIHTLAQVNYEIKRGRYVPPDATNHQPYYALDRHVEPYDAEIRGEQMDVFGNAVVKDTQAAKPKLGFVLRCPKVTCNGFINTENHLCGLCGIHVCPQCNVETEVDAAGRTRNHTCNPTDKESYDMLKKDAKSCPRCTATIIKSSGCDHMWCSSCKTHFNWRTGEILRQSSNPEYYEHLRRMNREIAREPGDDPAAVCIAGQGYPLGHALVSEFRRTLNQMSITPTNSYQCEYYHYNIVLNLIQFCEHLPTEINQNDGDLNNARINLILRAKYLNGEIDAAEFKRRALIEVNKHEFLAEQSALINTYRITIADILNRYLEFVKNAVKEYISACGFIPDATNTPEMRRRDRFRQHLQATGYPIERINELLNHIVTVAATAEENTPKIEEATYTQIELDQHRRAITSILMEYDLEKEIRGINDIINASFKIVYKMCGVIVREKKRYINFTIPYNNALERSDPYFEFGLLPVAPRKKAGAANADSSNKIEESTSGALELNEE